MHATRRIATSRSHASVPVMVVRDESPAPHQLIGVGVADTESCRDALTFALEEASLRHAGLHAIHSWHTPQSASYTTITAAAPRRFMRTTR